MSWPRGTSILANKGWLIVTASVLMFYYSADIYSFVGGEADDHEFLARSKRSELDPVQAEEDDTADPSIRVNRRILNETDSFTEVDGKKKPIPSKDLNKEYQEAKQRFMNPKPKCVNRTDAAAPAGGDAPAPPPADTPAEAPAPPPPDTKRRRKREEAKLPFCDELNKAPAASGGGGAAAPAPEPPAEPPVEPPAEG